MLRIITIILFEAIKALDKITASNIQDKPQGECNHDIVGGVVKVLVLGHAEQDQQVEDQNQGGQSRVAPHLRRTGTYFSTLTRSHSYSF